MIGVAGYDFRQLTGDSGPGARLGPFEGQVDAIGPAITSTTLIDKSPVVLSARHYEEFNAENRFSGSTTILSGTVRYCQPVPSNLKPTFAVFWQRIDHSTGRRRRGWQYTHSCRWRCR